MVTVLSVVAFVPTGQSQRQTTAPNIYVSIRVTLTDTKVVVSPRTAPRGTDARFLVHNIGTKPVTFTIGTSAHGVGVQTGFRRVLKPGTQKILLLYLNYRGAIPYYSGDSLAHAKAGTKGWFVVGAQCALCNSH